MRFDLHMHTSRHSHDSEMDPIAMLQRAQEVGLDGIVITEHEYWWPDEELQELRSMAPGLIVLAGIEVTAREGDVLCYGVREAKKLRKGMLWEDLCDEIHQQGGVAVAAHPFRWGQPFADIMQNEAIHLDGMEMMSKNMDPDLRQQAAEYAREHPEYAQLGNSDSHHESTMGCCHTLFDVQIRNIADLVQAIKDRKCRPVVGTPRG
ncbi:PHP domain-containing protein [Telmatocola sphagniphila]|uniref:PHP domain-containing protein n=2 Tax=Telmatocola sphagniphila TaxID=1123043 RepID=A0A8E6EVE8_9BACT|nr:PHP domain-containing protein [Telmatocola sphagniphila]